MSKKKSYKKNKANTVLSHPTKPQKKQRPKHQWQILTGLAVLLAISVVAVKITDKKGYFLTEQKNRHIEKRWESLYRLCPKDTIDVVVIGNSHVNTGINPHNLSCALHCTAFDLAPNGIRVMDAYYSLKELLTITKPKVVVIETYLLRNSDTRHMEPKTISSFYREFGANRNSRLKFEHLLSLYPIEYWLPAYSTTLRNHEMIFRNRDEIKENIKLVRDLRLHPDTSLYLGRMLRFTEGISDSVMHLYDSLGASEDGGDQFVSKQEEKYLNKIINLCRENGITPMIMTLPMYHRHVKNYDQWRQRLADVIEPTGAKWLDFQANYDTAMYTRDCFEDTYDKNQHATYTGSIIFTYRLAQYIRDSLKADLPDRSESQHWRDLFYAEEGWFENYSVRKDDKKNILLAHDTTISDIHVIDFVQSAKDSIITVTTSPCSHYKLDFLAEAIMDGKPVRISLVVLKNTPYDLPERSVYKAKLIKPVEIKRILAVKPE